MSARVILPLVVCQRDKVSAWVLQQHSRRFVAVDVLTVPKRRVLCRGFRFTSSMPAGNVSIKWRRNIVQRLRCLLSRCARLRVQGGLDVINADTMRR